MATLLLLLAAILTAQLIAWFLFRAARAARDFPDAGRGRVVMHYCGSIRLAAVVLPAGVIVLLLVLLESPAIDAAMATWLMPVLPVLALGAGALAAEAWSRRIVLDDEGIHATSVWGRVDIPWPAIHRVAWNRWLKMVVITADDGRRLWVNPSLSGLSMLQLLLFERVDRSRLAEAIPGFVAIGRGAY